MWCRNATRVRSPAVASLSDSKYKYLPLTHFPSSHGNGLLVTNYCKAQLSLSRTRRDRDSPTTRDRQLSPSQISMFHRLISILVFSLCSSTAFAIDCYNCNSHEHIDCGEMFIEENSQLQPVPCDVFEGQYCIKTTGVFEGQIGTRRFCSSRNYGNYCEYIKRKGDTLEYRSCVYTCTRDGCNHASTLTFPLFTLVTGLVVSSFLRKVLV